MNRQINVLDHGYVRFIESWGSDERVIESARMSTNKGFLGWGPRHAATCPSIHQAKPSAFGCRCGCDPQPGDEKLLKYLYDNQHATPFEFGGLVIEVQAPIFVFREWHRHRTQSYNEMSARYTPLPDVNYVPTVERLLMNAKGSNKQAGLAAGAPQLDEHGALVFQLELESNYKESERLYQQALGAGVPKELARVMLPVGRYSRMRASTNLRNWLGFLTLRSDKNPGAQWEIRQFANAVGVLVADNFPRTWELFEGGAR